MCWGTPCAHVPNLCAAFFSVEVLCCLLGPWGLGWSPVAAALALFPRSSAGKTLPSFAVGFDGAVIAFLVAVT